MKRTKKTKLLVALVVALVIVIALAYEVQLAMPPTPTPEVTPPSLSTSDGSRPPPKLDLKADFSLTITTAPYDLGNCTLTVKATGLLQFYVPKVTIDGVPYEWTSMADLPEEKREFALVVELRANRSYTVSVAPDRYGGGHGPPPYMFSHWSGDVDSSELSISILMDGDKVILAEYVPVLEIIVVLNIYPLQFLTPKVPVYVNGTEAFDARITALEPYTWPRPGYMDYSSFCWYGFKSNTVVNVSVPEYMPIFLPLLQLHAASNWQIISEAGYDAIFIYRVELVTGWMLALQLSILLAISALLISRTKRLGKLLIPRNRLPSRTETLPVLSISRAFL